MHKAKKKAETSGHTYSRFKNGPFLNQQDRVLYYDQILRAQYKTKLLKLFFATNQIFSVQNSSREML